MHEMEDAAAVEEVSLTHIAIYSNKKFTIAPDFLFCSRIGRSTLTLLSVLISNEGSAQHCNLSVH